MPIPFSESSAKSANSAGICSPFSIRSLILLRISVKPLTERLRRIIAGAYSTIGFCIPEANSVFNLSKYSPWAFIECTRAFNTPSTQSLFQGSSSAFVNPSLANSSARVGCSSISNISSSGRRSARLDLGLQQTSLILRQTPLLRLQQLNAAECTDCWEFPKSEVQAQNKFIFFSKT